MQRIAVLVSSLFVSFFLIGCTENKEKNKAQHEEQFFVYLHELAKDSGKRAEYVKVVEKLQLIVLEEVKKDPQAHSSIIEETVKLVPQAGPGIALQLEDYANEAVRNEMKRLREESGPEKLSEKEKQINELSVEVARLAEELGKYRKVEVDLSAERVEGFGIVGVLNTCDEPSYGQWDLMHISNWDDIQEWPEKTMKDYSPNRYKTNGVVCGFSRCSASGVLPMEFKASKRDLRFVIETPCWNNKKPLKYIPILISIIGHPKRYVPAAQLTDDGFSYVKGWILEEGLK